MPAPIADTLTAGVHIHRAPLAITLLSRTPRASAFGAGACSSLQSPSPSSSHLERALLPLLAACWRAPRRQVHTKHTAGHHSFSPRPRASHPARSCHRGRSRLLAAAPLAVKLKLSARPHGAALAITLKARACPTTHPSPSRLQTHARSCLGGRCRLLAGAALTDATLITACWVVRIKPKHRTSCEPPLAPHYLHHQLNAFAVPNEHVLYSALVRLLLYTRTLKFEFWQKEYLASRLRRLTCRAPRAFLDECVLRPPPLLQRPPRLLAHILHHLRHRAHIH